MRNLLFTLEYPPFKGGVANYYGELAKNWPISESLTIFHNNRQEIFSRSGTLSWLPAIFSLQRKVRANRIEQVLVGQILPLGTVAYFLSLFQSLPYAVFLHGLDFNFAIKSKRKRWLTKLILGRAKKIICANSYVVAQVKAFQAGLGRKIVLLNPGVESNVPDLSPATILDFKERYHLAGKLVLLSLGRLVKRKGADQVIKALASLPAATRDQLVYIIAGAGPDQEYLQGLTPVNLKNSLYFLGEISEEDKWAWLSLSDIFIMPARDIAGDVEGFGIVYLEANLCAKPVIAGDSGGVRDAVIDGYNGLLVDPNNPEAIKRAIVRLLDDPALREILGRQGRERALKDFNWAKKAAELARLLN